MKYNKGFIKQLAKNMSLKFRTSVEVKEFLNDWSLMLDAEIEEAQLAGFLNFHMNESDYTIENESMVTIYKYE